MLVVDNSGIPVLAESPRLLHEPIERIRIGQRSTVHLARVHPGEEALDGHLDLHHSRH